MRTAWKSGIIWYLAMATLPWAASLPRELWAAEIADATELYQAGEYRRCAEMAAQAIDAGEYSVTWRILKIRSDLATGRYEDARDTLEAALQRFRTSIRIRWLGEEVHRYNGDAERADAMLGAIDELTDGSSWRYSDPLSRVTLGRYYLRRGVDPKAVLENVFNEVKSRSRKFAEPFIAAGELALEKHDYGLAADEFEAALRLDARNPDIHYGLARAYASSDSEATERHLKLALARNPRHTSSLLFLVDNHLDAERYEEARRLLAEIAAFNIREPRAWAYRAVLAHLDNDPAGEGIFRQLALGWWTNNPEIDSLIGSELSQKYRFAEAARYQRRSLEFDPNYLPAKIALSQDLLRLGQEEEGWRLASAVHEDDGYNVVAHNLVNLQDHLSGYRTLETGDFLVRMDPREADLYGGRVLRLLTRAKEALSTKYEVSIDDRILVEIFARQQDFAIRTFGLPGGAGFLGVCFGAVITANSPASQAASPSNWESVLWHEYCHVVTLKKTHNKMPRWLSEGISVYEERQADAAWGQSMNPRYRQMILDGELTPVSELSGAFLRPRSPLHLQFAYYESSLVVEFLVEEYGLETIKRVLVDLGAGMPINESLQRYTGSITALDEEFAEFARGRATAFAPTLDWEKPEFSPTVSLVQLENWNREHPANFWGLSQWATRLVLEERWQSAKQPLEQLLELLPEEAALGDLFLMLAKVHRELGETNEERAVLEGLASNSADAVDAYLRLMELAAAEEDWEAVRINAQRMLAVNPLRRAPHRFLTLAAEKLGDDPLAVEGLSALALMEPHDPADIHFRLASRLHRLGRLPDARRHILQSLEEAPRFRLAHRKLLEILAELAQAGEAALEKTGVEPGRETGAGTANTLEADADDESAASTEKDA